MYSGFLAEVGGVWLYVTAGHILSDIRKAQSVAPRFSHWHLGDQTARNRFKNSAIPYAFDVGRWLLIDNEDSGLDYAVVVLEDMYCQLLKAGNAAAIDKSAWGNYVTERGQWALVGIPSETVSYDGETLISARLVVAPLEPVDDPPCGPEGSEPVLCAVETGYGGYRREY